MSQTPSTMSDTKNSPGAIAAAVSALIDSVPVKDSPDASLGPEPAAAVNPSSNGHAELSHQSTPGSSAPRGSAPPADNATSADPYTPADAPVPAAPVQQREDPPAQSPAQPFSWFDPHPTVVVLLVGPDEKPFSIQKDFLCAKSAFYRQYFLKEEHGNDQALDRVVKLPNCEVEVFCYAQHFMFTGFVFTGRAHALGPAYDVLIDVWKLGYELGIEGLCDRVLDSMVECRRLTQHIPATPLLIKVWKETPEGCAIRCLLLAWAAEYMRSSDSRAEFARSLPQEVLSELVVAMSGLEAARSAPRHSLPSAPLPGYPSSSYSRPLASAADAALEYHHHHQMGQHNHRKHHLGPDDDEHHGSGHKKAKRLDWGAGIGKVPIARRPDYNPAAPISPALASAPPVPIAAANSIRKTPVHRSVSAVAKPAKRKSSLVLDPSMYSDNSRLNFCADLIYRMLSGPGFWTRLVGPFKEAVDPDKDGVPDYFEKVKRPMDLGTVKAKIDRKEYKDEHEFAADVRLIFDNCYAYWTPKDPLWAACEKLQRSFEDKFSQMNKWISKIEGEEAH